MKFCTHCGSEINDEAMVCIKCGCSVSGANLQAVGNVNPLDAPSGGWAVLSFFFPLIGSILFLIWHNSSPKKAGSCAQGLAIATIVSAIFSIIGVIIWFAIFASTMGDIFSDFSNTW